MKQSQRKRAGKYFLTLFAALSLVFGMAVPASASAPVLLNGSSWLNGHGANVCSSSTDPSCGGETHVGGVASNWWQCVELAQRLYTAHGWHSGIFSGVMYAYQIFDQASALGMNSQANGSISSIVPGDMIIHGSDAPYSGGAGHVSIVDYVDGSTVHVVEQNSLVGQTRATYSLSSGTLSRSGTGTIRGVVHDPDNHLTNGTGSTPPPDTDGDGVPDASDLCPTLAGQGYPDGCTPVPGKLTGDFNGDGKQDVAAFYRYDGNVTRLFVFTGNGDGTFGGPVMGSYQPGWDGLRTSTAGVGDFNGDGKQDVAAFYRYDGNVATLFIFTGNGDGTFSGPITGSTQTGWDGLHALNTGVGDFNGDNKTDIATFYRYDGNITRLFIFTGNGNGTFSGPVMGSYQPAWDGLRTIAAGVADFNSDGKSDVAAFYRYDGNVTRLFVFNGNGDGTFSGPTMGSYQPGWDGLRTLSVGVGDFNSDNKPDVATFYRYDGNVTGLFVFNGNGDSTFSGPVADPYQTGWDGLRTITAGVADFNGDGKSDVATFYRYDGNITRLFIFGSHGDNTFANPLVGSTQTGWDGLRTIM